MPDDFKSNPESDTFNWKRLVFLFLGIVLFVVV
jgi:hypothetical protein